MDDRKLIHKQSNVFITISLVNPEESYVIYADARLESIANSVERNTKLPGYHNNARFNIFLEQTIPYRQKYEVPSIGFQTFFIWSFKIVIDSWKFTMLLLYLLWDD